MEQPARPREQPDPVSTPASTLPLQRSAENRVIGGVCGGLAEHTDIDPIIYRVLATVLTLIGGAGLILYGAAMLLVPDARTGTAPLGRLFSGGRLRAAGTALAVICLLVVLGALTNVFGGASLSIVVIAVLAVLVAHKRGVNFRDAFRGQPPGAPRHQPPGAGQAPSDAQTQVLPTHPRSGHAPPHGEGYAPPHSDGYAPPSAGAPPHGEGQAPGYGDAQAPPGAPPHGAGHAPPHGEGPPFGERYAPPHGAAAPPYGDGPVPPGVGAPPHSEGQAPPYGAGQAPPGAGAPPYGRGQGPPGAQPPVGGPQPGPAPQGYVDLSARGAQPPRKAKLPSITGWVWLLAALTGSTFAWLQHLGQLPGDIRVPLAAALAVLGLGLLVSAWVGRASVKAWGVLLTIALGAVTVASGPVQSIRWEPVAWAPSSASELAEQQPYQVGLGAATLDLSEVPMEQRRTYPAEVTMTAGRLVVLVPQAAAVDLSVQCEQCAGQALGHRLDGGVNLRQRVEPGQGEALAPERQQPPSRATTAPVLDLDITVQAGQVEVRRVP